ncbi:hypothetical protein ACFFX0_26225 [Citricoccus parietis]|uniref:Uncharacterized protein n=1 Tax=Citricoccus parietis TaxID=592307 RepID=A0ABV5G6B6_9MICC
MFDDGAGRGDRPEGFGITTMRQRANTAAGTLTVEDAFAPRSGDGATGTVVALSVPRWGGRS